MDLQTRIKETRKALNLTQEKFADSLGIPKRTFIAYECGQNPIPERLIISICAVHGVNEQWLRTGEGEMFPPMAPDMKVAKLLGRIMKEDLSEFKQELLETYANFIVDLSEEEAETLVDLLDKFTEAHNKTKEKK